MDPMVFFSICADIFCLILCVIGMAVIWFWRSSLEGVMRLQTAIFLMHGLQLLANLCGLAFKGESGPGIHMVLLCSNFLEYAAGYVLSCFLTLYILVCITNGYGLIRWKQAAIIYCVLANILLLFSQFTGMYYVVDAQNYYHRAFLYPLSLVVGLGSLVMDAVIVCRYRTQMERATCIAVAIYIALPIAAIGLQIFVYGIYALLLADTIGITLMFLIMLYVQTRRYAEKERQITEMRIAVIQSQVQPHFLYNILDSICDMCPDGSEAQEALIEFAGYLRGNLDSLANTAPVPFSKELEQVRHYLVLEKLRFGERIHVAYDIRATGFLLPMLTVQPLVENAIKHGLRGHAGGGTIMIASRELRDAYEISVADDGNGFVTEQVISEEDASGKSHVGIKNVRSRLEAMCHGTLELDSAPGKGTRAVIRIPKGKV